ncbi:unnamed protein product [Fraxinus pennsylvanica]|uniref:Myosin motor domain-containing protein n=1 Tax=Fraxinus pennsylvanica TaxID=56036 RepID=A0AAD1YV38_9LAMI|nr:unnamed protein product [Fraxinus pennsylvanica]
MAVGIQVRCLRMEAHPVFLRARMETRPCCVSQLRGWFSCMGGGSDEAWIDGETYIGNILIAANPFQKLPHLYDSHMMAQYKGAAFGELSLHPFAIADAAYILMMNERISQEILVSGESGAGKTESTKLIMHNLAYRGGIVEQQFLQDEDVELFVNLPTQNINPAKNMLSSEKPKKDLCMEKVQLPIFFPKLRKITAVPFKGSGKHKYSFQRVEFPSLPVHFCDCEEHSGPETVKEKAYNHKSENFGVNEEELNIMKSVMNKILERENCSNATRNNAGFTMEVHNSATLLNNVQVDDNGDDQVTMKIT